MRSSWASSAAGCSRRSRTPAAYETFRFLSKAFINLIKMLIVPLIFSTIVVGIGKTGDVKAVGRMGVKALIYFEIATTAALALGLTIAHVVQPGRGPDAAAIRARRCVKPKTSRRDAAAPVPVQRRRRDGQAGHPAGRHLRDAGRRSPPRTSSTKSGPFLKVMDSIVAVMFQLTDYVMSLTPLGVFGAMAGSVSHHGLAVLGSLRQARRVALRGADPLRAARADPRAPDRRGRTCACSSGRSASRSCWPSRRPPPRPRCRGRSRRWSSSACPSRSPVS